MNDLTTREKVQHMIAQWPNTKWWHFHNTFGLSYKQFIYNAEKMVKEGTVKRHEHGHNRWNSWRGYSVINP